MEHSSTPTTPVDSNRHRQLDTLVNAPSAAQCLLSNRGSPWRENYPWSSSRPGTSLLRSGLHLEPSGFMSSSSHSQPHLPRQPHEVSKAKNTDIADVIQSLHLERSWSRDGNWPTSNGYFRSVHRFLVCTGLLICRRMWAPLKSPDPDYMFVIVSIRDQILPLAYL